MENGWFLALDQGFPIPRRLVRSLARRTATFSPLPVDRSSSAPDQSADPLPPALLERRAALVHALEAAAAASRFEDSRIRDAVVAYADAVRAAGRAPEWLVIDLKSLILRDVLPDVRDWFRGVLRDRLVSWGITGYFQLPRE